MRRRRTVSKSCSRTTAAPRARWPRSSGPRSTRDDLSQRVWRHEEISRTRYHEVSPKLRAVLESYVAGVKRFMKDHPEQVPAWAQEIHPWDSVALSRYIIWGWPMGEAVHELGAAGVRLTPPAYRGSNEMLIAPGRTAMKAPIAVVDPHLGWYGSFRFYESRLNARDDRFHVSGVSILGQPLPSLGHSQFCSVAMTTGGPDTSDVYEEEINPEDPRVYRFDGHWRKMTVRTCTIGVKVGTELKSRTVDIEYTHHGPVVARKGHKAYTIAIPYMDQVGLGDQIFEMMKAHNLDEMKQALGRLQLMAQNVMVATVQGDIYYLRNGRVPIRRPGVDPSRPVPGNTSANEWRGIHPLADLVQITNPPGGWMQNCNCSPAAMMLDSPMVPEKYRAPLPLQRRPRGVPPARPDDERPARRRRQGHPRPGHRHRLQSPGLPSGDLAGPGEIGLVRRQRLGQNRRRGRGLSSDRRLEPPMRRRLHRGRWRTTPSSKPSATSRARRSSLPDSRPRRSSRPCTRAPAGCGPDSARSRSRTAATSAWAAKAAIDPGRSAAAR